MTKLRELASRVVDLDYENQELKKKLEEFREDIIHAIDCTDIICKRCKVLKRLRANE